MKNWLFQKDAATAIEYALIIAGIATAIVATVFLLGDTTLATLYQDLVNWIGRRI